MDTLKNFKNVMATIIFILFSIASSQAQQWKTYNDPKNSDKINFPSDWEIQTNIIGVEVVAISPKMGYGDFFQENINVTVDETQVKLTISEYAQQNLNQLRAILSHYQQLESGKDNISESVKSKWIIYTHRIENIPLKAIVYFFIKEQKGYAVTCTALPESFNDYRSIFENACSSFIPSGGPSNLLAQQAKAKLLTGEWEGSSSGWEFRQDGTFCKREHYSYSLGNFGWHHYNGRYSVTGDNIMLFCDSGGQDIISYNITNNKLTIDGSTYTRMNMPIISDNELSNLVVGT